MKISEKTRHESRAFCVTIVRRCAIDILRKEKRVLPVSDIEDAGVRNTEPVNAADDSPEALFFRELQKKELREIISRLPEDEVKLLVFRYVKEIRFKEIGMLMGISEDTARKRCQRVLEKLRALYEGKQN